MYISYVYIYICINVCMYMYMYIYECMFVCVYIYYISLTDDIDDIDDPCWVLKPWAKEILV